MERFGVIYTALIIFACIGAALYYGFVEEDVFKMLILFTLANLSTDVLNKR